jgi:hypothetical protein
MNQNRKKFTTNISTLTIHHREVQWKQFTTKNLMIASLLIIYGELFEVNCLVCGLLSFGQLFNCR